MLRHAVSAFAGEGYYFVSGTALALLGGGEDRIDVETVLGGFGLA